MNTKSNELFTNAPSNWDNATIIQRCPFCHWTREYWISKFAAERSGWEAVEHLEARRRKEFAEHHFTNHAWLPAPKVEYHMGWGAK